MKQLRGTSPMEIIHVIDYRRIFKSVINETGLERWQTTIIDKTEDCGAILLELADRTTMWIPLPDYLSDWKIGTVLSYNKVGSVTGYHPDDE